jgi:hypothetical protein
MKKLLITLLITAVTLPLTFAQTVSDYTYKLDNGITVKTEHCWNQVWVQQQFAASAAGDQSPLSVNIRTLGDLTAGSSFKLLKAGKEVKQQGAAPGIYDLKMTFKLSGKPGTLSFVINNVELKAKTKTTVSITLYDYHVAIAETAAQQKGLALFETKVVKFKGNPDLSNITCIPAFYEKGKHDSPVSPAESVSKTAAKVKPGTYDILISIGITDQVQRLWLENVTLKPDMTYALTTNLNGGVVVYSGGSKEYTSMRLYPAGTAAKQTGAAAPVKNLEIGNYANITSMNACAPGSYDILLGSAKGNKYEWKKGLVVSTGTRTEVK